MLCYKLQIKVYDRCGCHYHCNSNEIAFPLHAKWGLEHCADLCVVLVAIGFIFVGALVLYEKDQHTLDSLIVSPLSPSQYLWSKAITLSVLSLVCCYLMAFLAKGSIANHFYFIVGALLTSLMFVLAGFLLVADVGSLNQYILRMTIMVPLSLPLLNFVNVTDTLWFYLIPTQATLILFSAGVDDMAGIAGWQLVYSFIFLILSIIILFRQSLKAFDKNFCK